MNFRAIKLATVMAGVSGIALLTGCGRGQAIESAKKATTTDKVDVYSGGKLIASYISSGEIRPSYYGTSFYFKDKATGKDVVVPTEGTIITGDWKDGPTPLPSPAPQP